MKYYVATSFYKKHWHSKVVEYITNKYPSWQLTYDWTVHEKAEEVCYDFVQRTAKVELEAIYESDIVIVIVPAGKGTHVELGFALALNKQIILIALNNTSSRSEIECLFYHHPNIEHSDLSTELNELFSQT